MPPRTTPPAQVPPPVVVRPTPHGDKLQALAANPSLPAEDAPRVQKATARYERWLRDMAALTVSGDALLEKLVALLNDYKSFIEIDLIFGSPNQFLYRHKGQHKVDNSIMEEFLPWLCDQRLVPGLARAVSPQFGPQRAFAGLQFVGDLFTPVAAASTIDLKGKNQDFAVARQVHIQISSEPSFPAPHTLTNQINVAYFAIECKTNYDGTMANESFESARALKAAVARAKYLLVCDWLDMAPFSTALTPLDEVIVMRHKRLPSNVRDKFSTPEGRKTHGHLLTDYYKRYPLRLDMFHRIVQKLNESFPAEEVGDESAIIERGYF